MIGKNIRKLRKEKGWPQKKLAEQLLISQQALNNYEQGKRHPGYYALIDIADALGTSLDYLCGRSQPNAEEKIKAMERCIDYLIAEGGADTCGKCAYYRPLREGAGDVWPCMRLSKEGATACRCGMIKYYEDQQGKQS